MNNKSRTVTPMQAKFVMDREEWSDRQIELSKLYYLTRLLDKAERTRSNTSALVWWFIAIPFILGGLLFLMSIIGMSSI